MKERKATFSSFRNSLQDEVVSSILTDIPHEEDQGKHPRL